MTEASGPTLPERGYGGLYTSAKVPVGEGDVDHTPDWLTDLPIAEVRRQDLEVGQGRCLAGLIQGRLDSDSMQDIHHDSLPVARGERARCYDRKRVAERQVAQAAST